jgi:hypothetical protein
MKQTSVEWLITEVKKFNTVITREYMLMLLEQAKEMEKEQIEDAYRIGKIESTMPNEINTTGEQYYNETYGGEK